MQFRSVRKRFDFKQVLGMKPFLVTRSVLHSSQNYAPCPLQFSASSCPSLASTAAALRPVRVLNLPPHCCSPSGPRSRSAPLLVLLGRNSYIRIGLYSSETAELNRRDYGGHLCLLTHCSIPSGVTGKQRPAVPLGCDMSKEQRSSSPPGGGYAACLLQCGCRRAAITHPPRGIPMRE